MKCGRRAVFWKVAEAVNGACHGNRFEPDPFVALCFVALCRFPGQSGAFGV